MYRYFLLLPFLPVLSMRSTLAMHRLISRLRSTDGDTNLNSVVRDRRMHGRSRVRSIGSARVNDKGTAKGELKLDD